MSLVHRPLRRTRFQSIQTANLARAIEWNVAGGVFGALITHHRISWFAVQLHVYAPHRYPIQFFVRSSPMNHTRHVAKTLRTMSCATLLSAAAATLRAVAPRQRSH